MSISDRLDQIEADIPLAARSPEMAQHFTADHGPELLAALRAVLDMHKPRESCCDDCGPQQCEECEAWEWPCLTVRAIATALGEETP